MTALTRREKEVLIAINLGMTNREIAENLVISMETVKTHCHHLSRKMGPDFPRRSPWGQKPGQVRQDMPFPSRNGAVANSDPRNGKG